MPFVAVVWCRDADAVRKVHAANHPEDGTGHRIVGVYRWPSADECTCAGFCNNKKMSPWRRDRKGHMLCAVCGYRHRDTRKRFVRTLLDYLGVNLMKRDHTPRAFQNPPGYGT